MPAFLIYDPQSDPRVVPISAKALTIGRVRPAELLLKDSSVSRTHAQLLLDGDRYIVSNVSRNNQVLVNGIGVERQPLTNGDQVQIGRFLLVFHSGDVFEADGFPVDGTGTTGIFEITDVVPVDRLRKLRDALPRRERAIVLPVEPTGMSYRPGGTPLVFGGKSAVAAKGTWGPTARLRWDGQSHQLERKGWFAPVRVNGKSVRGPRRLDPGDTFQVGWSEFRYLVDEDW